MAKLEHIAYENLSARTYRQLRNALLDGQFEAGERIRIAELAATMGTSITPVREAIFRLVSEQALEMVASTLIRVPQLGAAQLEEIMTMRMLLEGKAAERAATMICADGIAHLELIHAQFVDAAMRDPKAASLKNREFHFELMRAAQMPLLQATVEGLWVMMGSLINEFHSRMPRREITGRQHQHYAVLNALKLHDPAAAGNAIRADLEWGSVMIEWARERELV